MLNSIMSRTSSFSIFQCSITAPIVPNLKRKLGVGSAQDKEVAESTVKPMRIEESLEATSCRSWPYECSRFVDGIGSLHVTMAILTNAPYSTRNRKLQRPEFD